MDIKLRHLESIGQSQEAMKIKELGDLSTIRSFWQYDDRVVAKLHGFADVQDYYRRSSSRQYLKSISVPTLLIQAADDPFMTTEVLPEINEMSSHGTIGIDATRRPCRLHLRINPFQTTVLAGATDTGVFDGIRCFNIKRAFHHEDHEVKSGGYHLTRRVLIPENVIYFNHEEHEGLEDITALTSHVML